MSFCPTFPAVYPSGLCGEIDTYFIYHAAIVLERFGIAFIYGDSANLSHQIVLSDTLDSSPSDFS